MEKQFKNQSRKILLHARTGSFKNDRKNYNFRTIRACQSAECNEISESSIFKKGDL